MHVDKNWTKDHKIQKGRKRTVVEQISGNPEFIHAC
jgi:hypothetical protein